MELIGVLVITVSSFLVAFFQGESIIEHLQTYREYDLPLGFDWFRGFLDVNTISPKESFPSFSSSMAPISSKTVTFAPTCSVEMPTLASSPIGIQATTVVSKGISIIPTETPPLYEGFQRSWSWLWSWFEETIELHMPTSTLPDIHFLISTVIFALYISTLLCIFCTSGLILHTAIAVVRRSGLEFARKVQKAAVDVETLETEAASGQSLLRGRVAEVKSCINEEFESVLETIRTQKAEVFQRLDSLQYELEDAALKARKAIEGLRHAAAEMQDQYAPFPTREELLAEDFEAYRAGLASASEELADEMASIRTLIPDFRTEFEKTVKELRDAEVGKLARTLEREKKKLRQEIDSLRKTREGLPALTDVNSEAEKAREDVLAVQAKIQDAVKGSRSALLGVPQLRDHLAQAETEIIRLKEDISLSRLTLSAAEKQIVEAASTAATEMEETTAQASPHDGVEQLSFPELSDVDDTTPPQPPDSDDSILALLGELDENEDTREQERLEQNRGSLRLPSPSSSVYSGIFESMRRQPDGATCRSEEMEVEMEETELERPPRLSSRGRLRLNRDEMTEEEQRWLNKRRGLGSPSWGP